VLGAHIDIYYVPQDPAVLQDARLRPPGSVDLIVAAILGVLTPPAAAGSVALRRYLRTGQLRTAARRHAGG
jgi:hypothetical protein